MKLQWDEDGPCKLDVPRTLIPGQGSFNRVLNRKYRLKLLRMIYGGSGQGVREEEEQRPVEDYESVPLAAYANVKMLVFEVKKSDYLGLF